MSGPRLVHLYKRPLGVVQCLAGSHKRTARTRVWSLVDWPVCVVKLWNLQKLVRQIFKCNHWLFRVPLRPRLRTWSSSNFVWAINYRILFQHLQEPRVTMSSRLAARE